MKYCGCVARCAASPLPTGPATEPIMPERFPASLQQKIEDRLRYYEDLGIRLFYTDRGPSGVNLAVSGAIASAPSPAPVFEEIALPKSMPKAAPAKVAPVAAHPPLIVPPAGPSLFEAVDKVKDDTLLKIREDLGECTRCKLHKGRNKIVFGDGNPRAELVFVGEGPGADEDMQGLPFVGRAGKLLTQMIEAMGLQRKDVYICNVVKCRPPENRAPEPDEVAACSPYLMRQIDSIHPKVIVCLGATAAKTILNTTRGISQFRGEWLEWRGHKLMATYHPAYLLRNPPAKADVWKDLQKVMAELGLQLPKKSKS
jgi:uracil-DNA glycosylase family 4